MSFLLILSPITLGMGGVSEQQIVGVWVLARGKPRPQLIPTTRKQLGDVSGSIALVLMGDFSLQDVHWKQKTEERKQSRRFLQCVEETFLTQLVSEPGRRDVPLDLLLPGREGLVGDRCKNILGIAVMR